MTSSTGIIRPKPRTDAAREPAPPAHIMVGTCLPQLFRNCITFSPDPHIRMAAETAKKERRDILLFSMVFLRQGHPYQRSFHTVRSNAAGVHRDHQGQANARKAIRGANRCGRRWYGLAAGASLRRLDEWKALFCPGGQRRHRYHLQGNPRPFHHRCGKVQRLGGQEESHQIKYGPASAPISLGNLRRRRSTDFALGFAQHSSYQENMNKKIALITNVLDFVGPPPAPRTLCIPRRSAFCLSSIRDRSPHRRPS